MLKKNEITAEIVREFLRYDPESGNLYWKERGLKWFVKNSRSAEHCARAWNNKHKDKIAFTNKLENGYLFGKIFMHNFSAHRVIWCLVHGYWPDTVDHLNGVRDDNRLSNLRDASRVENSKNSARLTSNRFQKYGVGFHKRVGKYRAYIGKNIHLGYFDTLEEAVEARNRAEIELQYSERHEWSPEPSPYKN